MRRRRRTQSELVAWLRSHPELWEGFPKDVLAGTKCHERRVFEAMQEAGLFSPRTLWLDVNLERLISKARLARRMEQQKPELN